MDQEPIVIEWTLRSVWTEYAGLLIDRWGSLAGSDVIAGGWAIAYIDCI